MLNVKCFRFDSVEPFGASLGFMTSTILSTLSCSKQIEFGFLRGTGLGDEIETGIGVDLLAGIGVEFLSGIGVELLTGIGVELLTGIGVELLTGIGVELLTGIGFELVRGTGVEVTTHGVCICVLTSDLRNTSIVSASLLLIRFKISSFSISTIFTLSMNIMKSPGSKCDLSAGDPKTTELMKHGLVQIMFDSKPNPSLKYKK